MRVENIACNSKSTVDRIRSRVGSYDISFSVFVVVATMGPLFEGFSAPQVIGIGALPWRSGYDVRTICLRGFFSRSVIFFPCIEG